MGFYVSLHCQMIFFVSYYFLQVLITPDLNLIIGVNVMRIDNHLSRLSRSIFLRLNKNSSLILNLERFAYFDTYAFMVFEDKFDS